MKPLLKEPQERRAREHQSSIFLAQQLLWPTEKSWLQNLEAEVLKPEFNAHLCQSAEATWEKHPTLILFYEMVVKWVLLKVKQSKCPPMDKWTNKLWSIPAMEYYSAIKKNEILIHATAWMNLKMC